MGVMCGNINGIFPRFKDCFVEKEYVGLQRANNSTLVVLEIIVWCCCMAFLATWLIAPTVHGTFYRINNVAAALYISVVRRAYLYFSSLSRHYDALTIVWGLHHLLYQSLSLGRVSRLIVLLRWRSSEDMQFPSCDDVADEGYQLLWCCAILLAFAQFTGTALRWIFLLLVSAPALWIIEIVLLGTSLNRDRVLKYLFMYIISCALSFIGAYKKEVESRKRFMDNQELQTWHVGFNKILSANFDFSDTVDLNFLVRDNSDFRALFSFAEDREKLMYEFGAGPVEQKRFQDFLESQRDQILAAPNVFHGPCRITISLETENGFADFEVESIWLPGVPAVFAMGRERTESLGTVWIGMRHSQASDVPASRPEDQMPEHELYASNLVDVVLCSADKIEESTDRDKFEYSSALLDERRSEVRSLPATTVTGQAFMALQQLKSQCKHFGIDLLQKLERIMGIGMSENWILDTADLKLVPLRILGSGGFGIVAAATLCGSDVAVKFAKKCTMTEAGNFDLAHMLSLLNELRVLRKVRHPNIVMFCGACVDTATFELCLVSELVKGTPLDSFICPPPLYPDDQTRQKLTLDISCATEYLHSNRPSIIHGDLKPANVMVERLSSGTRARLLDFGLSRLQSKNMMRLGGTRRWMAPEVKHGTGVPDPSSDVFSFALVMFFIASGLKPATNIANRVNNLGTELASLYCQIGETCLKEEASLRPTMPEVRKRLEQYSPKARSKKRNDDSGQPEEWVKAIQDLRRLCAQGQRSGHFPAFAKSIEICSSSEPIAPQIEESEQEAYLFPSFQETPIHSKKISALSNAWRWNVKFKSDSCCALHAVVHDLQMVANSLQHVPCKPCSWLKLRWQCSACGLLSFDDNSSAQSLTDQICDFCGHAQSRCLSGPLANRTRASRVDLISL